MQDQNSQNFFLSKSVRFFSNFKMLLQHNYLWNLIYSISTFLAIAFQELLIDSWKYNAECYRNYEKCFVKLKSLYVNIDWKWSIISRDRLKMSHDQYF